MKVIWNRWKYSEGKIHKSEPVPWNRNVNTVYFTNQVGEILLSVAQSLFAMNEYAITTVYLYLSFLLRITFIRNILLQRSFYA